MTGRRAIMGLVLGAATMLAWPARAGGDAALRSEAREGGSTASVVLERRRLGVQERLRVTVRLETATGEDGSLPSVGETLGRWRVASYASRELRRSGGGGVVREAELVLEPFLPGEYELPGLDFRVNDERGSAERVLRTGPMTVTVDSALDDPGAKIGDERGMIETVHAERRMWWGAGGAGALVLAVAGGIVVLIRRRKKEPEPLPDAWKIERLELQRELGRPESAGMDVARTLDLSAHVLTGWLNGAGSRGTWERAQASAMAEIVRADTVGRLEREIEELRFSGRYAGLAEVRRLADEVLGLTGAAGATEGGRS